MQDSGSMPPRGLWAGTHNANPNGSQPTSLVSPVTESTLTQAPMPDGVEPLDSRRAFIAVSPAMREVRRQLEQLAAIDGVVLLLGESGAGKEVAARMLHKLSCRAPRKFLKVNCAALPIELLESPLFGREDKDHAGKLEISSKGTILLDEITALPISAQARLVHVLQDGEFSRLGCASALQAPAMQAPAVQAEVRVLATTNADVRQAVQNGTLRPDLYYRLNVFTLHLPPLRDRREDLPHLLNHFMNTWAAAYGRPRLPITRRILEVCASYHWPGNVRELENFVKRYLVLGDERLVLSQLDHLPEPADGAVQINHRLPLNPTATPGSCDLKLLVRSLKQEAERTAILHALEQTRGNKQEAAILLRISLRALHYKVRAYAIESTPTGEDSAATRGTRDLHPMYPLARAANGGAQLAAPCNGKLTSPGNGKLISMDRAAYPPVR